jgi:hypothetical protein
MTKKPHPPAAHDPPIGKRGHLTSILDPDLELDAENDEAALRLYADERHAPPEDDPPEDDPYEVERAAESLPSDVPADRADRTDDREEYPPRPGTETGKKR